MKPLDAVLPELTSRELHAACSVAEHGSFMGAAMTLGLSQPALTRTVQRLEQAVGAELFRRTTRRVELTPAGDKFLAVARRVLGELRIAVAGLHDQAAADAGQVVVSAVMSAAYSKMPRLVAEHRATRPRVEVHLHEGVQEASSTWAEVGLPERAGPNSRRQ